MCMYDYTCPLVRGCGINGKLNDFSIRLDITRITTHLGSSGGQVDGGSEAGRVGPLFSRGFSVPAATSVPVGQPKHKDDRPPLFEAQGSEITHRITPGGNRGWNLDLACVGTTSWTASSSFFLKLKKACLINLIKYPLLATSCTNLVTDKTLIRGIKSQPKRPGGLINTDR